MTTENLTAWIDKLRQGEADALDVVVPSLYEDLRRLARQKMRDENQNWTLSTTGLVHEAYLKLRQQQKINSDDRAHFLALAGITMRRVLVDYARTRRRDKRGGGVRAVPLDDVEPFLSDTEADEVIALDDALDRLAQVDPRGAEVVGHRFFTGLTLEESAEVLGVSSKTVQRSWLAARAWLRKEVALELAG
ncbi:MAG: ECF-type sigma factor [Acidobacteriota bacterium]